MDDEDEIDYGPDCLHEWEEGICILCGDIGEDNDFSGATEGDR